MHHCPTLIIGEISRTILIQEDNWKEGYGSFLGKTSDLTAMGVAKCDSKIKNHPDLHITSLIGKNAKTNSQIL